MMTLVVAAALMASAPAASEPTLGDMCAVPDRWATPFTHVYHLRNGGTIVFVGVEHGSAPDDASHRAIAAAFDRFKPDFVLVEGTASSQADDPRARKFLVDLAATQSASGKIGENIATVGLADARGIPFSGWDLSPDQNYAHGVADGYAITDIIGTHLIHDRLAPSVEAQTSRAMARQLAYAARVAPVPGFDYPGWYKTSYSVAFDPQLATPCRPGIAGRIAADESHNRNLNLRALIDQHAAPGKVLLVEAGGNHWLALRPHLESIAVSVT